VYRIVKYRDLKSGVVDFAETKDAYVVDDPAVLNGLRELQPGDVLIGASGHDGSTVGRKLAIVEELPGHEPVFFVGEIFRIRARGPDGDPRWFLHYFSSEAGYRALQDAVTGGHLTNGRARQIPIPVAPPDVQQRLSDLLDVARRRNLSASKRLSAARTAIERFRQSVLAAACAGRLTAEWREREGDGISVEALLRHIADLRPRRARRGNTPHSPAQGFPLEFPEEWALTSLDALTVLITSGSRDWSRYYGRGSGTFVMAQNVRPGRLDWSFRQAVDPPAGDRSRSRSQIEPGDLLATIVGANTGDVGPVTSPRPEHYVCQSVALIRPADPALTPFLKLWFQSRAHGRGYFDECLYGAGRPHLSFDQLKSAPVGVPALAEQEEIVRLVHEMGRLADAFLMRVEAAEALSERISRAVLSKAFRGELVSSTKAGLAAARRLAV